MKFIDEAMIEVQAGKGGNGACSFLRLKYMPFGGPDGGNGGEGGSIYLCTHEHLNTLIDYRYIRSYQADNGENGSGSNCTGKSGKDSVLKVPIGTMVYDNDTNELIADLAQPEQNVCVAKGGRHGIGNASFKSSVNRSPRRTIPGEEGEKRHLRLELKLLADVGLIGLPNAGKSTLISAMSSAKPKIADYPFTTLHPHLGVVRVERDQSFVITDLPGLIEGAAQGAGLGLQFLKHATRTQLLFHVVDILPIDQSDPVNNINIITQELINYKQGLDTKPCWLILNKIDLLSPDEGEKLAMDIITRLNWQGKFFIVSGATKKNLDKLAKEVMQYMESKRSDPI